jgi:nucleotide-binding universal stress UspA family protein
MMRGYPQSIPASRVALPIILALVAAVGWGLLVLSRQSAAEFEEHLRGQVASLHQRQMELLNERTQREAAVGTLERLRSDVAALRQEQESLQKARNQLQTDLTRLREEQATAGDPSGQIRVISGATASPAALKRESDHASIVTAQRALTKLGYGPLAVDGIMGPRTRQAIEDFQHGRELKVTSELDPSTVRQLTASNQTATLE